MIKVLCDAQDSVGRMFSSILETLSSHLKGEEWSRAVHEIDNCTKDNEPYDRVNGNVNHGRRLLDLRPEGGIGFQARGRHWNADLPYVTGILKISQFVLRQFDKASDDPASKDNFMDVGMGQLLNLCSTEAVPLKMVSTIVATLPKLVIAEIRCSEPWKTSRLNTLWLLNAVPILRITGRSLMHIEKGANSSFASNVSTNILCDIFDMIVWILKEDLSASHECGNSGMMQDELLAGTEVTQLKIFVEQMVHVAAHQAARCILSLRQAGTAAFSLAGRNQNSLVLARDKLLSAMHYDRVLSPTLNNVLRSRTDFRSSSSYKISISNMIKASLSELERLGTTTTRMSVVRRQLPTPLSESFRDSNVISVKIGDLDAEHSSTVRLLSSTLMLFEGLTLSGGGNFVCISQYRQMLVMILQIAESEGGRESERRVALETVETPIRRILHLLHSNGNSRNRRINRSQALNP